MAHFAQLDENNVVIFVTPLDNDIITDENGIEQESLGIQHIHNTIPGSENYTWKQTSYNNSFRGNYASIGSIYLENLDIFTIPKLYPSWTLNIQTGQWESPVPCPGNIQDYYWDEETLNWILNPTEET